MSNLNDTQDKVELQARRAKDANDVIAAKLQEAHEIGKYKGADEVIATIASQWGTPGAGQSRNSLVQNPYSGTPGSSFVPAGVASYKQELARRSAPLTEEGLAAQAMRDRARAQVAAFEAHDPGLRDASADMFTAAALARPAGIGLKNMLNSSNWLYKPKDTGLAATLYGEALQNAAMDQMQTY